MSDNDKLGIRRDSTSILRARARALARSDKAHVEIAGMDCLVFTLAGERYAVPTDDVDDVQPLRDLTPLPLTPPFLRGIVNVRGQLIGVIDLKRFFDLPEAGITDLHRVILLRSDEVKLGLLADTIEGVMAIDTERMHTAPTTLTGIRAEYVQGVTAGRLVVLDADAILSDPRILVDDSVEG